ncbi:MAG: molybdopterin-dependent oxidoreductase [Acidobacteriia bacterium]|nr:molybdopterin-dependent oxidoreductase [Terriglobia bacterium]
MKPEKLLGDFNRRDFFRLAGGAAVGTAAAGVTLKGISTLSHALTVDRRPPRGPERWVATTCQACAGGCGLMIRMIGKRAVKVVGNSNHPINRGGVCPKGQGLLQALYHPDRLRQPLWQSKKGSGRWEPISWDQAVERVADRLLSLRKAGREKQVAVLDGARASVSTSLWRQFLGAIGSPNYFPYPGVQDGPSLAAHYMMGAKAAPAYDLKKASYVLSFGVNLLEGWGSPAYAAHVFGSWRAMEGQRTKFVQISPRLSITAAKADEWVPIRPGTEAALALGIAHVIISERRFNEPFVSEQTFGFDEWTDAAGRKHTGFSTAVLRDYPPNLAADVTGVPVETILRLGREFAANPPALALGDQPGNIQPGTLNGSMAVLSLNALVGNFEQPGGVLTQEENLPATSAGKTASARIDSGISATASLQTVQSAFKGEFSDRLADAVLNEKTSPLELLIIREANPAYMSSDPERFSAALARIPLVVNFASLPDDTTEQSDLLLPVPTFLETQDLCENAPVFPHAIVGLTQAVVPPRFSSRSSSDVLLDIVKRMGSPIDQALRYDNFEQVLQLRSKEIYAAQRGNLFGSSLEEVWDKLLERGGWWSPEYSTAEELWEQMKTKGGWWDFTYPYGLREGVFQTPSRKFEFFSQIRWNECLAKAGRNSNAAGLSNAERLCLPHYAATVSGDDAALKAGSDGQFPLSLYLFEVLPLSETQGADLPYMQQILGQHLYQKWDSWIEIHPETAHRLGIEDGSWAWVETPNHKFRIRARWYEGLRPEVVAIPVGLGHHGGSRWSRGRGVNPCEVLAKGKSDSMESSGNQSPWIKTRVRIFPG